MQTNRMRLTNPEAARVLADTPVLYRFLEERNPSDVAKEMEMPANLVHHHVKRGAELGLLNETRRENGRVYYQLTAQEFTFSRLLLGPDEKITKLLSELSDSFLEAYRKSEAESSDANDPDYHVIGFVDSELSRKAPSQFSESSHPAHLQSRTIKLSAVGYQRFIQRVRDMIDELERESQPSAEVCTVALLGFKGELQAGNDGLESISSFVPLPPQ
jgi:DNA-binding transcriptional ArsR family regulator